LASSSGIIRSASDNPKVHYQEGAEIYYNECYDNGRGNLGDNQCLGVGIWADGTVGNHDKPTATRFTRVHNNATNTGGVDGFAAADIAVDSRTPCSSENNRAFNNTSNDGRYRVKFVAYDWQGCSVNNNRVKNTVIVGASEHNLYGNFGGDNDGSNGLGSVYEYNNLDEEAPNIVSNGSLGYETYDAWESAYGQGFFSVEGGPQLSGVTHDELVLTYSSPCRDAGFGRGAPYNGTIRGTSAWTEFVGIEDQDALGSGWEIGAFGYTGEDPPNLCERLGNWYGLTVVEREAVKDHHNPPVSRGDDSGNLEALSRPVNLNRHQASTRRPGSSVQEFW
jgi:hypothetical protein